MLGRRPTTPWRGSGIDKPLALRDFASIGFEARTKVWPLPVGAAKLRATSSPMIRTLDMSDYQAPLDEMRFQLEVAADLPGLAALPGFEDCDAETAAAILDEAGKLANEVWAPTNRPGDQAGCQWENGVVRLPEGFPGAYGALVEGGWLSLPFEPAHGGQGLPWTLALAVQETWHAANMSLGLCPLLSQGAIELLQAHGSADQKARFLPNLIAGTWSGTMNLTEPQAGSDLGAITTRAEPDGDLWRVKGQKIFITFGEHELTENIVHLVLARTPDAPAGSKGLSLFIVPKYRVDGAGAAGPRNDLRCLSVERKMGIHAAPTCVMAYGENEGAQGELLGEVGGGLACMFTMMNNARLMVGLEGLAQAEAATQRAIAYARERRQGGGKAGQVPIISHPDVRRMLATMKAETEAARALAYYMAAQIDRAKRMPEAADRAKAQARLDLVTPIIKAWGSEVGCEVADLGVQVHGGMGFVEDSGAAQHLRDVRITPIYEGTNGIQALDLIGRKLGRDQGAEMHALIADIAECDQALINAENGDLKKIGSALGEGRFILEAATDFLIDGIADDRMKAAAVATPYLRLAGWVVGGWMQGRSAAAAQARLEAGTGDPAFLGAKLKTARFYAENLLPRAAAEAAAVMTGADSTLALTDADF